MGLRLLYLAVLILLYQLRNIYCCCVEVIYCYYPRLIAICCTRKFSSGSNEATDTEAAKDEQHWRKLAIISSASRKIPSSPEPDLPSNPVTLLPEKPELAFDGEADGISIGDALSLIALRGGLLATVLETEILFRLTLRRNNCRSLTAWAASRLTLSSSL